MNHCPLSATKLSLFRLTGAVRCISFCPISLIFPVLSGPKGKFEGKTKTFKHFFGEQMKRERFFAELGKCSTLSQERFVVSAWWPLGLPLSQSTSKEFFLSLLDNTPGDCSHICLHARPIGAQEMYLRAIHREERRKSPNWVDFVGQIILIFSYSWHDGNHDRYEMRKPIGKSQTIWLAKSQSLICCAGFWMTFLLSLLQYICRMFLLAIRGNELQMKVADWGT